MLISLIINLNKPAMFSAYRTNKDVSAALILTSIMPPTIHAC